MPTSSRQNQLRLQMTTAKSQLFRRADVGIGPYAVDALSKNFLIDQEGADDSVRPFYLECMDGNPYENFV